MSNANADLVLYNGRIYTMNPRAPLAQGVAIGGGRFVAVGSNDEISGLIGLGTTSLDLEGRAVIPGLIDCHLHFAEYALGLSRVNLDGARSVEEAVQRVAERVREAHPGEWILGFGWNHNAWERPVFPDKNSLDRIAPANPVALTRKDGHLLWVNTLALQRAGITAETEDPAGGRIDREAPTGHPTGILREEAMNLVRQVIPRPGHERLLAALRVGQALAHRLGLTGVHDCGGIREGPETLSAFQEMHLQGELSLRVYMMIPGEKLEQALELGLRTGLGDRWLRVGAIKMFADGTVGSQTADMLEDFEGQPGNRGLVVTPPAEMASMVRRAHAAGLACAIHAIGDAAVRRVLDVYQETLAREEAPRLRHRIEHVQLIHPTDIPRLGRLGIVASMQPIHAPSDMLVADKFWGRRSRYAYAWRSLLDGGAPLAFGSDCPVESLDPLAGIHAAVTRQRANGEPTEGWYPEERVTVQEAMRAYTLGAAYASGEEAIKGSIEAGKLADLVVLSRDIFTIPPQEILETGVECTIVGGKIVYSVQGSASANDVRL